MMQSVMPLILLPIAAAAITFLVRKSSTLAALIAAGVPAILAIFALLNNLDNPFVLLGRVMILTTGDRLAIVFIFLSASATFLGIWRTSPRWTYYPVALAALSAVAAALGARWRRALADLRPLRLLLDVRGCRPAPGTRLSCRHWLYLSIWAFCSRPE